MHENFQFFFIMEVYFFNELHKQHCYPRKHFLDKNYRNRYIMYTDKKNILRFLYIVLFL